MRGTRRPASVSTPPRGIIPAYAGNTSMPSETQPPRRDHPRVCGEHDLPLHRRQLRQGSSPRMRGTPLLCVLARVGAGIIPAYAGNTLSVGVVDAHLRDHPRVCGEHIASVRSLIALTGSSPRMRGTLENRQRILERRGIIPAYAGNTHSASLLSVFSWDHPRVCGEHKS